MSTLASGILWSHGKEKGRGKELADDIDYRRFLYAQSKNERKEENGKQNRRD